MITTKVYLCDAQITCIIISIIGRTMTRRILLAVALFLILCLAFLAGSGYRNLNKSQAHNKASEYITVPKGSSTQEVISQLREAGIIEHELPLLFYIKARGLSSSIKAGDYRFPSPISPLQTLEKLQEGQQKTFRFTVIEGWTRWDITNALIKLPQFKANTSEMVLAYMNNTSKIKEIDPQADNLEGFLYPDTYFFPPETSFEGVINTLVNKSKGIWTTETLARTRQLGQTPRQILTIASLIETEAKLAEERPVIASVIYNRLKINMTLGIDSSIIYAAKLAGKWKYDGKVYKSDLERQSPYNTRLNRGLPPGPIASPSASSVSAALNPSKTDYLYYVRNPARNDGAHNFYNNDRDFTQGVQALRDWEKRQTP